MSQVVAVIGAQWGDEGKGKIVDLLAEQFDIVARYQGGHNAGHSVQVGDQSFVLHLLPSGIVHRGKTCVLGNGMVIDPKAFFTRMIERTMVRKNQMRSRTHLHPFRSNRDSLGHQAIGFFKKGFRIDHHAVAEDARLALVHDS